MDWALDINKLRELLVYDAMTGSLLWLPRKPKHFSPNGRAQAHSCAIWNTRYAGKQAFTARDNHGYFTGTIYDRPVKAHRVAFALHHGKWPDVIDHANGDKSDNRISNLRDVDRHGNNKNLKRAKNNTSGFTGVRWDKKSKKWAAQVQVKGKKISLGHFYDKELAIARRVWANQEYGFYQNHGATPA